MKLLAAAALALMLGAAASTAVAAAERPSALDLRVNALSAHALMS